ncbi:hypothetical protein EVAR_35498_1 [Eumeta japonica]|uniref:Uncharacterized protein n=1 Tax=Eumeta variegata TaxID=151549 RepID=A0A4C1X8P0_EUMVA|nr:hypothetical protein EVAR_35498_1 [Eumeta japonica]
MVNDLDTNEKARADQTPKLQDLGNKLIKTLVEIGVINKAEGKQMKTYNALAPRIYDLRKTYKPGCKFRPVFTLELENNRLPFLNILVEKSTTGELITSWYKKLYDSGRILNFNSNHPLSQKLGVAQGFLNHAIRAHPQEITDSHIHQGACFNAPCTLVDTTVDIFLRMCLVGMKRVRYLSILWNQYSIIWIEIRSGEADSRVSGGLHAAC